MDIFNKEKIQELEKENKEIKKLLVDLNKKLIQLESNSEEWNNYQKWKEMKDSFPDIEEMFELKKLKKHVQEHDNVSKIHNRVVKQILKTQIKKAKTYSMIGPNSKATYETQKKDLIDLGNMISILIKNHKDSIDVIIKKIKKNKDLKIIDMLKLYGIEADWILGNE